MGFVLLQNQHVYRGIGRQKACRTGVILFIFFSRFSGERRRREAGVELETRATGEAAVVTRSKPASLRFRTPKKREKITPVLQARNWHSPNFSTIVTINDKISTQKSGDSHDKLTVSPYFNSKDCDARTCQKLAGEEGGWEF